LNLSIGEETLVLELVAESVRANILICEMISMEDVSIDQGKIALAI
jgi:hypothetical protein